MHVKYFTFHTDSNYYIYCRYLLLQLSLIFLGLHKSFLDQFKYYCDLWRTRSRYATILFLNSGQNNLLTIISVFKIYYNPNISVLLGKSHLLRMIANCATDKNLAVCVSAPTGKLAARYKQQLPNCKCNTVHSNFTIPVAEKHTGSVNWSLSDVHVLLIDEVLSFIKHVYHGNINSPFRNHL